MLIEVVASAAAWDHGLSRVALDLAEDGAVMVLSPRRRLIANWQAHTTTVRSLLSALTDAGGRAVDLSDAWRPYLIAGPAARTLLERGIELDLSPANFLPGRAVQTLCAGSPVILHRVAPDVFHLLIASSYADWLHAWLLDDEANLPSRSPEIPHCSTTL